MSSNLVPTDLATMIDKISNCQTTDELLKLVTNAGRLQRVNYFDEGGNAAGTVLAIVLLSNEDIKTATSQLNPGKLASKFILMHLMRRAYLDMLNDFGRGYARQQVKHVTAHNQKLGFNYLIKNADSKGFYQSSGQNFAKSGYVPMLKTALSFWKATSETGKLVQAALDTYTISDQQMVVKQQQQFGSKPATLEQIVYNGHMDLNQSYSTSAHQSFAVDDEFDEGKFNGPNDFRNTDVVGIDDVKAGMMILPELVQLIIDKVETEPEQRYAIAIVAPFFSEAKGSRIPSIMPDSTVTSSAFMDLNFTVNPATAMLIFTCGTAWNCNPVVIMNNIAAATLNTAPTPAFGFYVPQGINPQAWLECQASLVPLFADLTITDFLSNLVYSQIPYVDNLFASVRVVAAGCRIYKTSASTVESGVIKGLYSERGTAVASSLGQLINYYQDDQTHARIYTAGGAGEAMGRAGFMIGSNYKPTSTQECEEFYPQDRQFLADTGQNLPGNAVEAQQTGPVRVWAFFQGLAPITVVFNGANFVFNPNTYYLYYQPIFSLVGNGVTFSWFLDTGSLVRKHIATYLFEDIASDTTFELQYVQHFEGIPTGESQYLETRRVIMDQAYSTPLDILRRLDLQDFRTGENLNLNMPDEEVLQGIFQHGYLLTAKNALHKLGEKIAKRPGVRDRIVNLTPALAKALLQKMGMSDSHAMDIKTKIQQKLKDKFDSLKNEN